LLGLPRFCSASGMFADAGVEGFAALIRKRAASLMRRVRDSTNNYLQLIVDRVGLDCPVLAMWTRLHVP
ncbi:hypothetical protein RR46_06225, partial [Papilio xuthus]